MLSRPDFFSTDGVGESESHLHSQDDMYADFILRMMLTGLSGIVVIEIYAAVMQREFQNTDNKVGKGFAVLGIYLFVTTYYGMLNSTTWLYGSEVLPIALRSKVMGLAAASHFIVNVGSELHSFNRQHLLLLMELTIWYSHGSWSKCVCQYQGSKLFLPRLPLKVLTVKELLLCLRLLQSLLPRDGILLLSVSP